MHLFIGVIMLVAVTAQLPPDLEQKIEAAVMQISKKAQDVHSCSSDTDCASLPLPHKCDNILKFCTPTPIPQVVLQYGSCNKSAACLPMYRCKDSKCQLSGPKACDQDTDCLQGIKDMTYRCVENAKTLPGKRCWAQCTTDQDCHSCEEDQCRVHHGDPSKFGCCQGSCQLKSACM